MEKNAKLNPKDDGSSCSKKLSALLRAIASKNNGGFYFLHSFRRSKKKLHCHKRVCQNKDFCNEIMTLKDSKMLEFNQNQNCDKTPFIIFADRECII